MTVPGPHASTAASKTEHHAKAAKTPPAPRSFLLVEDDEKFASIVRAYLEQHGYEVLEARDGGEAVRLVMARDFDVILCDMVMPNFPGDMFYRAVERTKPDLCRRFIFMTGFRGDQKITEFIGKVGGFILWKPFEFRVMMEAIATLEGKRLRRSR
jgi:CheY-like chemotaxis protein